MLNCEKFNVHANYLGGVEEVSKVEVRLKALEIIKGIIDAHLQEVELQLRGM